MDAIERVAVGSSKLKVGLLAAGSFAFVGACIWLLSLSPEEIEWVRRYHPSVVKGVAIAGIGLFSLFGFWWAAKFFDNKPGLIFDSSGITDSSSAVAAGLIPWREITGFGEFESQGQKMVVVLVREPEKYIAMGNPIRRALNKANFSMVGSPISISSNSLDINHAQLVELCMRFHQSYGSVA